MRKLVIQDLLDAPMFTVWENQRGKTDCLDMIVREHWDLFDGADVSDLVLDNAIKKTAGRMRLPLLTPQRDDTMDPNLVVHLGGSTRLVDDLEACLCALEYGVSLIKLPDNLRSKYWRLFALNPLPGYWNE